MDVPGHERFIKNMLAGIGGIDVALFVVAADEGVMPQTREAISHARAAHVPIIVALNKIDKANANPERVKQQLAEVGLVPDEWDGDTIVVPVSATEKTGLEDLLSELLIDDAAAAGPRSDHSPAAHSAPSGFIRGQM